MKKVLSITLSIIMLLSISFGSSTTAMAASGHNSIYPTQSFMQNCIDYGYGDVYHVDTTLKLPFTLISYSGNYYERYYIYIYDSNGDRVASDINYFPNSTTITTLTCTWKTSKPGTYYVRCEATYQDSSTYWPFYVEDHSYTQSGIDKASKDYSGRINYQCTGCSKTKSSTIARIDNISLSNTSYTYSGGKKTPTVTVTDEKGKTIDSKYYTVSYTDNVKIGKAKAKVTFKGRYTGTYTKTFKINPTKTSLSTVTPKSKAFKVSWKKHSTNTSGFELQYAKNSGFTKSAKKIVVSSNTATAKTISGLSAKTKYYVRIRTYKTVNGTKYYSGWSGYKTVTTK